MTRLLKPAEIEAAAQALVSARETNLGIEVSLPVVYPNGEAVTVVVTVEGGEYLVHDAGFGTMYLTSAGVDLTRNLAKRLAGLAARYGCDFINGRMSTRCTADQLAVAIAMVANASRTVGDHIAEVRRHTESDFAMAVTSRLQDAVGKRLRAQETVTGASGRRYKVGNIILDAHEHHPIAFVESFASRATVANHFMEFSDLRDAYEHTLNLSVYDENERFPDTDLRLLRQVSDVVGFNESRRKVRELVN